MVRTAAPEDVPFLREMIWTAILASPGLVSARGIEELRKLTADMWSNWPRPGEVAFVATDGAGQRVGAVVLFVQEREGDRVIGYRFAIGVVEGARGKGVGRRLVEHAKRYSQDAGAAYLFLRVDPSNDAAIHLYETAGFEPGDEHGLLPMIVRFHGQPPES